MATLNIESFIFYITTSFSQACLTIISQNYGTGTMKSDNDGMKEAEKIYKNLIKFFPSVLILLIILNLFNIISRIGNCMGISTFEIKNEDTERNISEGKNILENLNQKYGINFESIENNYLEEIIFDINIKKKKINY